MNQPDTSRNDGPREGQDSLPGRFFILGAPKTGTTALARYLAEHDQVHFMSPKEPQFFNTDHAMATVAGREEYDRRATPVGGSPQLIGEGSVWYLYSQLAVPNIEAEFDAPRYIVSLRNPLELAPSLHLQMLYTGFETEQDFARAWALQDERRSGRSLPVRCPAKELLLYRETCQLGAQLARLYEHVPRSRVKVLFIDDFRDDPAAWWRDAQDFLGIEHDGRSAFETVNPRTARKSNALHNTIRRADGLASKLRIPRPKFGLKRMVARWNTVQADKTEITPELRAQMAQAFADDVALLAKLTGRRLDHWLDQ